MRLETMNQYPNLFKPLRVKNVVFRNRIFAAPNMICYANWDGSPSHQMIGYFERKARGGCAMVTMGDTPVDEVNGTGIPRHVKLIDKNVNTLAEMAFAIKKNGAVASFELNHPGRAARNADGRPAWGPDGFVRPDGTTVLEMDEEMIEHTVQCYANAAAILKRAGWDMCILHGAHGWLLGQFLSPATNHRTDRFGGSLENRARFPIMVIDAVRKAVGPDFLIDYRISGDEMQENGLQIDECIEFVKMVEDKIDMVHVSAGLDTATHQAIITHPNTYLPNGCNVKYAEAVKKSGVKIPVTTIGGINTPEMAEEIIASGKADAVAMCRALIADPDWPKKVKEGRLNEIHQCLRCTNCLAEMHPTDQFHCDVNPFTCHEIYFENVKPKAEKVKTVWIAGGGPGGMTAAITAAERGHKVTLFESSDKLGGSLNYTDKDQKFKRDLHLFKEKLVARVGELPIEVRLNQKLTPELVQEVHPDALFLAIGAAPVFPPIPGLSAETVTTGYDCYQNPEKVGHKVVCIGGGLVGAELAIYLADQGHEVTVVEMTDKIAAEANMHHGTAVRENLEKYKVNCLTSTRCVAVKPGAIEVEDAEGKRSTLSGDTIVLSAGYRARTREVDTFFGLTEELAVIGDCKKATRVRGAVHDGVFAALNLG